MLSGVFSQIFLTMGKNDEEFMYDKLLQFVKLKVHFTAF